MSPDVEIEVLREAQAGEHELVQAITQLINEVYAVAEEGLWVEGTERTSTDEVGAIVAAGEIAVARIDGDLVGCVRVQRLAVGDTDDRADGDGEVGEFGMLAADPVHRSRGIGRDLVAFAEDRCRRSGLGEMQLELLVPREWTHPSKDFLHRWYTRIGYRPVRTGRIDESYPHLAPLLATPCDFVIYRKSLAA